MVRMHDSQWADGVSVCVMYMYMYMAKRMHAGVLSYQRHSNMSIIVILLLSPVLPWLGPKNSKKFDVLFWTGVGFEWGGGGGWSIHEH